MHERDPLATHVWVMRHGPTAWNVERRIQGNVENPILDSLIEEYLERVDVAKIPQPDRIVVSKLERTFQTAEAIRRYRNWPEIPVFETEALNERKWGIFEGKVHAEVVAHLKTDPDIVEAYPDFETMENFSPIIDAPGFKVEGSETMDEVAERVTPVILSYRNLFPGEKVFMVSHAGVMISQGLDHRVVNEIEISKNAKGDNQLVKIFPR